MKMHYCNLNLSVLNMPRVKNAFYIHMDNITVK